MLESITEVLASVGLSPFHLCIIGGLVLFFLGFYMNEQLLSDRNKHDDKTEGSIDD